MTNEERMRRKAYENGCAAAHIKPAPCPYMQGTIFFDDWHDGLEAETRKMGQADHG
jgi:hypothetical protein